MTRSVKDLRELICVSRLTYRESSENSDPLTSDDSTLASACENITLSDSSCKFNVSPDSGCVTNASNLSIIHNTTLSKFKETNHRKTKRRKKRPKKVSNNLYDIPKTTPLPPVTPSPRDSNNLNISSKEKVNFDQLMVLIDTTVITSWLSRSNNLVNDLYTFCNHDQNYVRFAKFWLTEFSDMKKQEIYELEFNILVDELALAFSTSLQSRNVNHTELMHLLRAVYKEYPGQLLASQGNYVFLNYLDVLSSNRTGEYKKLLSDVRCSTSNQQHAQWLLAIRAFSLVNVWSAIVNFYVKFSQCATPPSLGLVNDDRDSVHAQRMIQAVRLGYSSVIQYLFKSRHVDAQDVDSNGKSWIFHAVISDQISVLMYLLTKMPQSGVINTSSDSGNTALHAAANTGNVKAVRLLLQVPTIQVDIRNPECDGATPLHLAIMHGHKEVAKVLLDAGADLTMAMGDMSVWDIAETFSTQDILAFLKQYTRT